MIRSIALLGDTHANIKDHRWTDHCEVMDWIADDIDARGCDGVAHTGDLWEGPDRSEPEERDYLDRWVLRNARRRWVAVLAGNHDNKEDVIALGRLAGVHPIVAVDTPAVHVLGGIALGMLPWPRKASLLATLGQPVSPAESSRIASETLVAIMRGLGETMAEHAGPRLFACHAMIRDAKTDHDQPIVGADMEVGFEDLARLTRAHFVACGHVHAQNEWNVDGVPVVYTGAPRICTYGQVGPKGYVIAKFDDTGLVSWERIATPCRQLILTKAEWVSRDVGYGFDWEVPVPVEHVRGSEFRVRYVADADQRDAARRAMEEVKARLLADGAIDVKIEPSTRPVSRARAPEIARASTTADQLREWVRARGIVLDTAREERVLGLLTEIDTDPPAPTTNAGVRLDRVRARSVGPFRDAIDVDFMKLAGEITAICGINGAGKSTFVGLLAAGLFREFPLLVNGKLKNQSLADLATAPDAFVTINCVNGKALEITQTADPITGKGESVVVGADGKPVLPTTSIRQYGAWRKEHLPDDELLYASTFAPQGSLGVLSMPDAERRGLLMRAVGGQRFAPMAERAGKRLGAAKKILDVLAARIAAEASQAYPGGIAGAEDTLSKTKEDVRRAAIGVTEAQAALATLRAAADTATAANRAIGERRAKATAVRAQVAAIDAKIADFQARLANNRAVLGDATAIRAAVEQLAAIDAAIVEARAELDRIAPDVSAAKVDQTRNEGDLKRAIARVKVESERADRARTLLADRAVVDAASAAIGELRGAEVLAAADVGAAENALAGAQAEHLAGAEERNDALRHGLTVIRDDAPMCNDPNHLGEVAGDTIDADDTSIAKAAAHPKLVADATTRVQAARAAHRAAREALSRAEATAARAPAIARAADELAAAETEIAASRTEETEARAAVDAAGVRLDAALRAETAARSRVGALTNDRAQVAPAAARAERLSAAEARIAEIEPQIEAARAESVAALALFTLEDVASVEVPVPDTREAERVLADAERTRGLAERAEGAAEKDLATARDALSRTAQLATERQKLDDEIADFTLLGDALGSKGIPALIVDAYASDINAAVNEFLHEAFGPRFTASLVTTRVTDDGNEVETCSLQVLDNENGREADAQTYSGGEKTILGEALRDGLTVVSCDRTGVYECTLVRDESGSALDGDNARRYVLMLRKVARRIRAPRVLLISHAPDIWACCDGIVRVEGGRIHVGAPVRVENGRVEVRAAS